MSNELILQKADLALTDLATAGRLNPEQSDSFIRKLQVQPTLLNQVRTVAMNSPQMKINKIGFGTRIMRKAISTTPLHADQRVKPDLSKIELNSKELICEVHLPYDVVEDNIERGQINFGGANSNSGPVSGGIKETIVDMIVERAAVDLEDLAINGDTAVTDNATWLMDAADGFLKLCQANDVDHSAVINRQMFKKGLKSMPKQYLRELGSMRHFVSIAQELEYRDAFASRETAGGDRRAEGNSPIGAFGVRIEPVALMPEENGLLVNPRNLIWGIQRDISIEVGKDIRSRVFIVVLTMRCDFQVEEVDAVVQYKNITSV